ncbi:MAG: hypothetical protein AAFU85_28365 [Planctomycetota bacterium]
MSDERALERRLVRIEKELRFWRTSGLCAVVVMAGVLLAGAKSNPEIPRLIRANEFQLVDEAGQVRATLKKLGNSTQFRMHDASKQSEIAMVANDSNAIVKLDHDQRANWAVLEAYSAGGSVGLSGRRDQIQATTEVRGGMDGTFIKLQPVAGEEIQLPAE